MKRVCNCAKRWNGEPDEQKIHMAIIYHRPVCYLHDNNFNRSISEHLFPPPKDIRFSIIEHDRNKKISTFNKLESENFCLLLHKKMTQTYKLIIQIVRMNLIADNSSINQLIVANLV